MRMLYQLAWIFTLAGGGAALLGLLEVGLAYLQRRRAFRNLPSPDCIRDRGHRGARAYAMNERAFKGLRE